MSGWGGNPIFDSDKGGPPVSTGAAIAQKQAIRDELAQQMAEYEALHAVTIIPYGVRRDDVYGQMKRGEVQSIGIKQLAARWGVNSKTVPLIMSQWPHIPYIVRQGERAFYLVDIERLEQSPDFIVKKPSFC